MTIIVIKHKRRRYCGVYHKMTAVISNAVRDLSNTLNIYTDISVLIFLFPNSYIPFLCLFYSYMHKPKTPVIVLALSNEHTEDGYLSNLTQELKDILTALEPAVQKGKCHLKIIPAATQEDITKVFQDGWYEDRIWIFHYAGHADQDELWLETATGENKSFFSLGLSRFLGVQESLKMVFLNGCATEEHAELLLEEEVPAVIATSRKIADDQALTFAKVFYQGLAGGANIEESFKEAESILLGIHGKNAFAPQTTTRSLYWADEPDQKLDLPWKLFLKEGASWFPAQWKLYYELGEQQEESVSDPEVFVGTIINNYEIIKYLGQGRLGAVYIANHTALNEERAIKLTHEIKEGYDLFKSVVLAGNKGLGSIKHPNVVEFYDVGEFDFYGQKRLYMVMELMKGDRLDKKDLMIYRENIELYLELVLQLAAGLEAAHKTTFEDEAGMPQEGIVHGNFKTKKIHFSDKGVPKITDFLFSDFSRSRKIKINTPNSVLESEVNERLDAYFPPEVLAGKSSVNKQTDIYSLGAVMFEVLTGEVIADFEFDSVDALHQHFRSRVRSIPRNIAKVIFKATHQSPELRYKSTSELIDELLQKTGLIRKIRYWFRRK
jgi:hypothetical protein